MFIPVTSDLPILGTILALLCILFFRVGRIEGHLKALNNHLSGTSTKGGKSVQGRE